MRTTNSSTSSSDPAAPWRRFRRSFVLVAGAAFAALLGAAVALDPYDTGRLALLQKRGVAEQAPRTANASRGRDPAFDGAVFGNSHIQLLSPDELRGLTGIPFVSLIAPATGPKEQLTMLDYFLRHRARPPGALVIGIDGYWCTPDPALPNWKPFPFWLYDPSPLAYLRGLVRFDTLERITQRIESVLGKRRLARPDGYWDYEQYRTWRAEVVGPDLARFQPSSILNETGRFPAFEALAERMRSLPAETAVVLVRPPVYRTALPEPGTPLALSEAACLAAARRAAASRPRTALVDWRDDRPENGRIESYFDHTHYRAPLARALEREIAAAIRDAGARP